MTEVASNSLKTLVTILFWICENVNKCSYTFALNGPASICRCCWDNKTYNITVLHTDFRQSLHTNVSSMCGARMHIYRQAGQLLTAQAPFLTVCYEVFSVLLPFILAQMFSINFLSKIRADPAELGCKKVTGQKLGVVGWSAFWTVAPEIDETIDTKSCCAVALSVPSISCAAIQNAEYKKKVTEKKRKIFPLKHTAKNTRNAKPTWCLPQRI